MVFDIYATDDEMTEMMPFLGALVIIIAIGALIYWLFVK